MHSVKPLIVYSIADTAIDLIAMSEDGARYMSNRDPSLVKFVAGAAPTEFTVNRIDSDAFAAFVECESSLPLQRRAAFRLAVSRIRNIVDSRTGALIADFVPSDKRQVYGNMIDAMSDEDLRRIPPAFIDEIGEVARMRSFLPLASADSFHPHATLRHVFAARLTSQGAEQLAKARSLAASRKSKESLALAKKAKPGAKATDATATGKATKRRAPAKKARKKRSK